MSSGKENLDADLASLVVKIGKKELPSHRTFLELEVSAEVIADSIDAVMPTVKYKFK